jgi:putative cell wall-binding protein
MRCFGNRRVLATQSRLKPSYLFITKIGLVIMIRKLKSGEYRLSSRKKNVKTGKRRNLGTFKTLEKAKAHERAVQYFKRH